MRCGSVAGRVSSFDLLLLSRAVSAIAMDGFYQNAVRFPALLVSAPLDQNSTIVILGDIGLDWRPGGEKQGQVRGMRVGRALNFCRTNFV
jgi:hypothetical protein